jgi:hypothetical protein
LPWQFFECRERIGRAKAHRERIAKLWNEAGEAERLYDVIVYMEDDGTGRISLTPTYSEDFMNEISLELGELLYQLRAALDGCIYKAAIIDSGQDPPPNEENLEFPVCFSDDHFQAKSLKIAPLKQERRDIVKAVQPYNILETLTPELMIYSFNRNIKMLNDWARKDRHRRLHVAGSWVVSANPKVRFPLGVSLDWIRVTGAGFLEHQSKIADFKLAGYRKGMQVQANPDLTLDIGINEGPPPCSDNDTLGNRLRAMMITVFTIVTNFEDSF